jgi:hypothetical protein
VCIAHMRGTHKRYKTLGVKWLIERSTSHQGSVSGDTFAAPKSPTISYRRPSDCLKTPLKKLQKKSHKIVYKHLVV